MPYKFLDLEAEVDDEDFDDYDDEEGYDFIDDMEPSLDQSDAQPSLSWSAFSDPDKSLDDLLSGIYQRSRGQRTSAARITGPNDSERITGPNDRDGLSCQDYPLWRIGCRVGLEEDAVFSLLQRAGEGHQIRSAFTRGSIRGWVYVEGLMNNGLTDLLKSTPGVIHTRNGLVQQTIDMSDWTKMLMMHDPTTVVGMGRWVRVSKGVFKGDIGLVVGCENWGAEVLLVPRLKAPTTDHSLKRKRSTIRPQPTLFDPIAFKYSHDIELKTRGNGVYTVGGSTFEHGLIRKKYDLHSLSSDVLDIPSHLFSLFQSSEHPTILVSAFPRPQEWS
ncbi:hypothetical protein BYT27DRAFT_7120230, partial [Phlegmacium glaucopus]